MIGDGEYGPNDNKSKMMIGIKERITAFERMDHYQSGRTLPAYLLFNQT